MLRRVLRLARMLCALMYRQNGDLANLLKSAGKKCPRVPVWVRGVQSLFGQCPNAFVSNFVGASRGGISIGGGVCKASLKLIWSWAIVGTQCSQLPPRPHRLLPKGWNETKGNSSVIKTNQARFNLHISLNNEHFYLSLDQEGKIWRALAERAGSSLKGRTPNIVNIVAIYTLFLKDFRGVIVLSESVNFEQKSACFKPPSP